MNIKWFCRDEINWWDDTTSRVMVATCEVHGRVHSTESTITYLYKQVEHFDRVVCLHFFKERIEKMVLRLEKDVEDYEKDMVKAVKAAVKRDTAAALKKLEKSPFQFEFELIGVDDE